MTERRAIVGLRSVLAACCAAAIGGLLFVVFPSAASAQMRAFDTRLTYTCAFPAGEQQVAVRLQGALPVSASPGSQVQPEQVQASVTLQPSTLTKPPKIPLGPIQGSVTLTTVMTQGAQATRVDWPGLVAAPAKADASGRATVVATGQVPAVKASATGTLAVAAGAMKLTVAPAQGVRSVIAAATTSAACRLDPGQRTRLAVVAVSSGSTPAASMSACPTPYPTAGNPALPSYSPGPDAVGYNSSDPGTIPPLCALADGFSNVAKLNSGVEVHGVATARPNIAGWSTLTGDGFQNDIAVVHTEPATGTFLGFGFVPVTATVRLTEIGTANVGVDIGLANQPPTPLGPNLTDLYAAMKLDLSNASVNGVPLNLGPGCRASEPVQLHLHGTTASDPPLSVDQAGGPFTGMFTIPRFTGCGVGEDLDPLLNASVAGSKNYVSVLQGPACYVPFGTAPTPCPPIHAGTTVMPAGDWSGNGSIYLMVFDSTTFLEVDISCTFSASGNYRRGSRLSWFGVGEIDHLDSACNIPVNALPFTGPATATTAGLPWKIDIPYPNPYSKGFAVGDVRFGKLQVSLSPDCQFDLSSDSLLAGVTASPVSLSSMGFSYDLNSGIYDFTAANGANLVTTPTVLYVTSVTGCVADTGGGPTQQITLGSRARTATGSMTTTPVQKFSNP